MNKKFNLALYYKPGCPFCFKVLECLKALKKEIPLKSVFDTEVKQEYHNKAPKTQVPCLMIDNKPLYESDAIVKWLTKHQKNL